MSETEISVDYRWKIGKIRIDPQKIQGADLLYPRLHFQIEIEGSIPRQAPYQTLTILHLWGSIYIQNQNKKLSNFQSSPLLCKLSKDYPTREILLIELPITYRQLTQIEEKRKNDLRFKIDNLKMLILTQENQLMIVDIPSFELVIPHSYWIEQVLPKLGYGKFKLIEIPIPEKVIPENFKKSLEELEQAQKHYTNGIYDKAIDSCRIAIEQIRDTLPAAPDEEKNNGFPTKVKKRLKQHLPEKILSNTKREKFSQILGKLWDLTSLPHHLPSGYFNRYDAEMAIGITTYLLSYIGKLLEIKQKEEKDS